LQGITLIAFYPEVTNVQLDEATITNKQYNENAK
jgi:hypothetical protein